MDKPEIPYELVYTEASRTHHLLHPVHSPNSFEAALCGRTPGFLVEWLGTGSQEEHEMARKLPLCEQCQAVRDQNAGRWMG
jgi:hypothetical protein